jgi:flagellum-specific ATP synthase
MDVAATYLEAIDKASMRVRCGQLLACNGTVLEAHGPDASLGELCEICDTPADEPVRAQIVGFRDGRVVLMPLAAMRQVSMGARIRALGQRMDVAVSEELLGRVVDGFGNPIDGKDAVYCPDTVPLHRQPINPMRRGEIDTVMETGVRSIDSFLTIGRGQRVGIFAGSGIGKSTLLGMLTTHARADVIVVALIGERGREVGDFIAHSLKAEGLARSIVIAATADQPPLARVHAVYAAHAIAEYFRDCGKHVLLILDSMTRFAMAQREIGIAAGEPPTARGYPPSVFTQLPQFLERCGNVRGGGSISAVYSVLVEGDDMNEPVADHMRAILDGHIVLSRELADQGQFPAVDVLRSISRLMPRLATKAEGDLVRSARALFASHERARDLISMGAYQPGHDIVLDRAVKVLPELQKFLQQAPGEYASRSDAMGWLGRIICAEAAPA